MKKYFALILALAMLLSITACTEGQPTESKGQASSVTSSKGQASSQAAVSSGETSSVFVNDYSKTTVVLKMAAEKLKLMGRTVFVNGMGVSLENPGNGLLFNADCEGTVSVKMKIKMSGGARSGAQQLEASGIDPSRYYSYYLSVYVDGKETQARAKVTADPSKETTVDLILAENLSRGEHSFGIYRQSEDWLGTMVINSITVNGVLSERPADKKTLIEFVGDSLTAGYGNVYDSKTGDGQGLSCQEYENCMLTYGVLTAQALDVDYSVLAKGGATIDGTLKYYGNVGTSRTDAWGFERKADIVVINLGTNDRKSLLPAQYKNAVKGMIAAVKEKNPDAKIVWALGMSQNNTVNYINAAKEAIADLGGEGAGYYYCQLTGNAKGGGSHPDVEGHKAAAAILTEFLKKIV